MSTTALVLGMGAYAFGRERRAVSAFDHMQTVEPRFLISPWGDGSVPALLDRHGFSYETIGVGYLGWRRPHWSVVTLAKWPGTLRAVGRAYRRHACEVVIVLNLHAFLLTWPAVARLRSAEDARTVFYLGDIPGDRRIDRFAVRRMVDAADAIVVNSRAVRSALAALGVPEERVEVVYNGVELDAWGSQTPRDFRAEGEWSAETFVVGFVGQIRERKGVLDVLHAVDRLSGRGVDARLVLLGKGAGAGHAGSRLDREVARLGMAGKVLHAGWTSRMAEAYAGLDAVVVASRYPDPAPNVCLEGMASGIPVVGTRIGGTPELLEDGVTGILVPPGDPEAIADALAALAADPGRREAMGRAGRERVADRFDAAVNARRVESAVLGEGLPAGTR